MTVLTLFAYLYHIDLPFLLAECFIWGYLTNRDPNQYLKQVLFLRDDID